MTVAVQPGTTFGPEVSLPATPRSYVRHDPVIRRLLAIHGSGQMADAVVALALAQVVVFDIGQGASPAAVVRVTATALIPYLVACTVAANVADRWSRRPTLLRLAAMRACIAAAAVLVPLTASRPLGYTIWALATFSAGLATNLRSAALAHVVPAQALTAANSLSAICGRLAGVLGFVTSVVVGLWSQLAAVTVAMAIHLGAALGYAATRLDLGGGAASAPLLRRAPRGIGRHVGTLFSQPGARRAVATALAHRAISAAAFVTFILFIDSRYHLEASGLAVAIGLTATGTVIGTIVAPFVTRHLSARRACFTSFVAGGVLCTAAALHTVSWLVTGAMIGIAFTVQLIRINTETTVQRDMPSTGVGGALASYDRMYNIAYITGAAAAIAVVPRGTGHAFTFSAAAYALALAIAITASVLSRIQPPPWRNC
jgi:MFS family permease